MVNSVDSLDTIHGQKKHVTAEDDGRDTWMKFWVNGYGTTRHKTDNDGVSMSVSLFSSGSSTNDTMPS